MKKIFLFANNIFILAIFTFLLSGCVKDGYKHTYTVFIPVYKTLSQQRSLIGNKAPTSLQNTGKIYVKDNWIFINEKDKGIHVIDNSNPSQPKNIAFWNIPGNRDLAVEGNTLYADLYCDIVAIDISDPNHISVDKFLTNVDPSRLYFYTNTTNPDSINVVTDWIAKDTTVTHEIYDSWIGCMNCPVMTNAYNAAVPSASTSAATATGTGSSEQRFTISKGYLYALGNYLLNTIDISSPANPSIASTIGVGENAQTIYPFNNDLFVGTLTGMFVYDVTDPANPQTVSWTAHWCMGDPVISDGKYAYVTLSASTKCHTTNDQLEIFDVTNLSTPQLVKTYSFTNPLGLTKDGNLLFICDASDGLKIFDATDVSNLKLLQHLRGVNAQDVIAANGKALVIAEGLLVQYDYSDINNVKLLSSISSGNQ